MWMPRYLRLRWDLARVKRDEKKLSEVVLVTNGDVNEMVRWQDANYEWRQQVLTRYWVSKADSLGIELPDWLDKSLRGHVDYDNDERTPWYFTPAGIARVRADVREEQKHRREIIAFWLSGSVGVIGALTGLAAILKG